MILRDISSANSFLRLEIRMPVIILPSSFAEKHDRLEFLHCFAVIRTTLQCEDRTLIRIDHVIDDVNKCMSTIAVNDVVV